MMRYLARNLRFANRLQKILIKYAIPLDMTEELKPEEEDCGFELEHGHDDDGPYMVFFGKRSTYSVRFPNIFGAIGYGECTEESVTFMLPSELWNDRNALNIGVRYVLGNTWWVSCWVLEETEEAKRIANEVYQLIPEVTDGKLPPDIDEGESDPDYEEPTDLADPCRIDCDVDGDAALKILSYLRDTFLSIK